jgi:hypothetical protein
VSNPVALNKKPGNFQKEDEEEACDVLLLRSELVGTEEKSAKDGHRAAYKDEKAEQLQKEIEERAYRAGFELMGEGKEGNISAQFN